MKKIISIILCVSMLFGALVLISCTPTAPNEPLGTPNQQQHVHAYGDWIVTKEATCIETGIQTQSCSCGDTKTQNIPMLEEHIGIGKCSSCGLEYYDVLWNYIKTNGTKVTDTQYNLSLSYAGVEYLALATDSSIQIKKTSNSGITFLTIRRSSTKYGSYEWTYFDTSSGILNMKTIKGSLEATHVYKGEPVSLEISKSDFTSSSKENSALRLAEECITTMLNNILPMILNNCGENISMYNIAFERFE